MSRQQPEYRLQCALARHLRARLMPSVYWTALPFGEKRSEATGARLKAMGVRAGAPDLLFIVGGRPIGLELKAAKGRQTDTQKATELDWTLAGGLYAVAVGMDQALQFLEMVGVLRPDVSARAA